MLQRYKRYFSCDGTYNLNCFTYNCRLKINPREARCGEGSFSASIFTLLCPRAIDCYYIIVWKVWLVSNAQLSLLFLEFYTVFVTHRISDIFDSDRIDFVLESEPFTQRSLSCFVRAWNVSDFFLSLQKILPLKIISSDNGTQW